MAIETTLNFYPYFPGNIDSRLGPYSSSAHATGSINSIYRYVGMTVFVSSSTETSEYWWKEGTANNQLIPKTSDGQTYYAGKGIVISSENYISASIGDGLEFNGSDQIQATVRTVNLQGPTNGNISLSITNTITGPSSSLSGSPFFLPDTYSPRPPVSGTIFVVSGDVDANKNGNAYIFVTSSTQAGSWQQIFGFNETTADLRYVKLSSNTTQNITSSLLITGSSVTFSSSIYWMSGSIATTPGAGVTASVVVLGNDNKLYITGAYGVGGGTGTNQIKAGSVGPLSFQNNPLTASITFNTAMGDTNYGVSVIGGDARSWTIDNKTINGFIINTNSSVTLTTSASWIAAPSNNP